MCHGDGCKRGPPAYYKGKPTPQPEVLTNEEGKNTDEYNTWLAGYKTWGVIRCPGPCRLGYFCRRHGLWITGFEVGNKDACQAEDQVDGVDTCPPRHTITPLEEKFAKDCGAYEVTSKSYETMSKSLAGTSI